MSIQIASLKNEIIRLEQARLKDAEDHEQALRVVISMMSKRGEMLRNQKERAGNWFGLAMQFADQLREQKEAYARLVYHFERHKRFNTELTDKVGQLKKSVGELLDQVVKIKRKKDQINNAFKRACVKLAKYES